MNIKDYLHLYLGCEFIGRYVDWDEDNFPITITYQTLLNVERYTTIKPILRPLSSMTGEEKKELEKIEKNEYVADAGIEQDIWTSKEFLYLLSKHFDLFGLIDAGLAIDKTKL